MDSTSPQGTGKYSLEFDGDDWINIGDSDALELNMDSYTFELWFRTDHMDAQQQLIRKGYDRPTYGEGRWVLSIDTTNVIRIVIDDVYGFRMRGLGETIVTDGAWHHVAAVFDRDQGLMVYIDGMLEVDDSYFTFFDSIHNPSEVNVYIGRSNSHGYYFYGNMYDIRIWNYARTSLEVEENMFTEYSGSENNLVCYYKMEEGGGQQLIDHAGSSNGWFGSSPDGDENDPEWSTFLPNK